MAIDAPLPSLGFLPTTLQIGTPRLNRQAKRRWRRSRRQLSLEGLESRRLLALDLVTVAEPLTTSNGTSDLTALDRSISDDGRFIAFRSSAANFVTGDTNGLPDIFVRDTLNHVTTRVSSSSTGAEEQRPVDERLDQWRWKVRGLCHRRHQSVDIGRQQWGQ